MKQTDFEQDPGGGTEKNLEESSKYLRDNSFSMDKELRR